jgi:phage-related minor tail protein
MADHTDNAIMHFGTTGEVEYASTLKQINAVMTTAAKVYKAQVAAMGDSASTTDKLAAQQQKLQTQLSAASKRTQMYRDELQKLADSGDTTSTEYTKLVGKLADSEKVEANLTNALNKTNAAITEQSSETGQAKAKLADLQGEGDKLNAAQKELASSAKLENAELAATGDESAQTAAKQRQLQSALTLSEKSVANLEAQLKETKTAYGENSTEAMQMGTKLNAAKTDVKNLENQLNTLGEESNDTSSDLDELGNKLDLSNAMDAVDKLSELGDKITEIGKGTYELANDYQASQQKIQASMGGTSAEAEKLNGVVKRVFEGGVVESVDEATEAVTTVKSSFSDLNNTDLTKLTNQFIQLSQKTGTEVPENVNAAKQLMTNFGISSKQALDLIAAGYQNNLNKNGDYLDTLNEYPTQFAKAGYSAEDMFSILTSGMKSGAFNTDKAADAVKELGLKLSDKTTAPSQYFGQFSKGTQEMILQFRKGKATSAEVSASMAADLKKMTPTEQTSALSQLGTQFEDLGNKGTISLLSIGKGYDQVGGKASAFNKKTDAQKFTGAMRKLQGAFVPLIGQMTPVVQKLSEFVSGLAKMPGPAKIVIAVTAGVLAAISAIAPVLAAISAILPMFAVGEGAAAAGGAALSTALLPIIAVILAVIAAITAVILVIKNWGSIVDWLKGVWNGLTDFFSTLWAGISNVFHTVVTALTTWLSSAFNSVVSVVQAVWEPVAAFFSSFWDGVKTVFQFAIVAIGAIISAYVLVWKTTITLVMNAIKAVITVVWNAIKAFFGPIISAIGSVISTGWNAIKSITSSVFNTVKSVISTVWNAIKSVITTVVNAVKPVVTSAWNAIKSVTSSVFNAVKSVVTTVWNTIKTSVTRVVNAIKAVITAVWNAIKSTTSSVFNAIKKTITSVWNGIKSTITSVVNGVKSTVTNVWNGIKSTTASVWNGIKSAITTPINAAKTTVSKVIDTIKGFFSNIRLKLPKISMPALPHFKLTGKFSLKPPSVPHLGVDWYAQGGIMTSPTLMGFQNGRAQIGGEAGPEAAIPLNDATMARLGAAVAGAMPGQGPTYLQVDGQTFGRLMAGYNADASGEQIRLYGGRNLA